MLIQAVNAETNTPVVVDTKEFGVPPRNAIGLLQPEPGERPRWITSHKEAQELLWDGADIVLLKTSAGASEPREMKAGGSN
jgi:hypothetical protein